MSLIDELKDKIKYVEDDISRLQKHFNEAEEEMYFWRRELSDAKDKLDYLTEQLETELNGEEFKEDEDE
jgi:septal ring factor EnvC (AmiA/AmiB activator)